VASAIGYACEEVFVRRLFSTFARGWPGVGLLLIRVAAGASLMIDGFEKFQAGEPAASVMLRLLAIGDGALLIAGLWTPIAGSLVIGLAIWQTVLRDENPYPGILLAAMGAALALVGPGVLSMDAWLFGWKRIDIEN
jgi:uncharacterized membrane protein YphA (DoxX/SURF4 family)